MVKKLTPVKRTNSQLVKQQVSAGELARLARTVEKLDRVSANRWIGTSNAGGGPVALDQRPWDGWVEITDADGVGAYAWSQLVDDGDGTFTAPGSGAARVGTLTSGPAYEVTGNVDVPIGAIVHAWIANDHRSYLFWWSEGVSDVRLWYLDGVNLTTDYKIVLPLSLTLSPTNTTIVPITINLPTNTTVDALKITKPGDPATDVFKATVTANTATWTIKDPTTSGTGSNLKVVNTTTTYDTYTGPGTTPALINTSTTNTTAAITTTGGNTNTNPPTYNLIATNTELTQTMIPMGTTNPVSNLNVTSTAFTDTTYALGTTEKLKEATATATTYTDIIYDPGDDTKNALKTSVTNALIGQYQYTPGTNTVAIQQLSSSLVSSWEAFQLGTSTLGLLLSTGPDYVQLVMRADATQDRPLLHIEDSGGNDKVLIDQNFALTTVASTTTTAGLKVPPGTAPTSPANGDIWVTSASIFARVNGVTYDLLTGSAGPGGADTYVQFNDGGVFGGVSGLTWNKGAEQLTITGGVSGTDTTIIGATITLDGSAGGGDAMSISADGATGITTTTSDLELSAGSSFGVLVGTASTDLVGLWGATPVAQYNTTGTTTGFTAGSGTAAKDDSTYTGNTGSTAYTVGDIVKALKLAGIIAT